MSNLHLAAMAGMPRGLHFEMEPGTAEPSAGTTAPTPTVVAPPQPEPTQGQSGQAGPAPSIDPQEYQRLQRLEQQYKGSKALLDPIIGAGIKDPDGVKGLLSARDRVGQIEKFEKATGLKFDTFLNSLNEDKPQTADEADEEARFKAYAEKLGLISRDQLVRETAQKEYDSGWESLPKAVSEAVSDELLKEMFGDNVHDGHREMARAAMTLFAHQYRDEMPDDHPLKKDFGHLPPTKASVEKAVSAFRETWKKAMGADLDSAASEAAKRKPPASGTPAGSGSGQGPKEKDDDHEPNPIRAHAEEVVRRRRAAGGVVG